jgi:hypothetical protein
MNHYADHWIENWCRDNGWTDWFIEQSKYWGFPPNAVMPVPIPSQVLRSLKAQYGLCHEEQLWSLSAIGSAVLGALLSYWTASPMPLVTAFAYCAIVVARMDDEEM